jgi:hypothetical protein
MIGHSAEMRGVAQTLKDTAEALEDFALQIAANAYLGAACLATGTIDRARRSSDATCGRSRPTGGASASA